MVTAMQPPHMTIMYIETFIKSADVRGRLVSGFAVNDMHVRFEIGKP